MRVFNKVFGIGISRTGTTSLTVALEYLGIPTIHWPTNMLDICKYPGATDITVACRFRELDLLFPGSLFIYTEREMAAWHRSVRLHYAKRNPASGLPLGARQFAEEADIRIYGSTWPKDCDFKQAYSSHEEAVLTYFADKSHRLLRLNVSLPGAWARLCDFLAALPPAIDFPHRNRRSS